MVYILCLLGINGLNNILFSALMENFIDNTNRYTIVKYLQFRDQKFNVFCN
jgi:hypothetical protein